MKNWFNVKKIFREPEKEPNNKNSTPQQSSKSLEATAELRPYKELIPGTKIFIFTTVYPIE
jgi:hypothetical protein